MNALTRRPALEPTPCRLAVPEAAGQQLLARLRHPAAIGEAFEASAKYAVSSGALCDLLRYCEAELELQQQALFDLPCFEARLGAENICFVHARSSDPRALPLLLVHGYSASLAEFQQQIAGLTAGDGAPAFHVVCPSLPGFGLTSGEALPRSAAAQCAGLMAQLGYPRYLVHGSDLGAKVALELAALDEPHVAALHVTALPTYPAPAGDADPASSQEKSQLLRLAELEAELEFALPESPLEELAYALSRSDEELGTLTPQQRAGLLTGLLLSTSFGNPDARASLHRLRLEPAPRSAVPIALHAFPLDAPSLRRAALERYRVVEWHEHALGGCTPALEQPELWLSSLRSWGARLG
jgi:pimeloyl-ACP methyl ester carboxylesterase